MTKVKIVVCVCTFRRPQLLRGTLEHLRNLDTAGLFDYSVVVTDNDKNASARSVVEEFSRSVPFTVVYGVEPEQNISLARNHALRLADGDFVALIDDDEFPSPSWLLTLFRTLQEHGADGVLGPVKPVFETEPPAWIRKGRFFEKPRRTTGLTLKWNQTSTANVLIAKRIIEGITEPFRREFGSGCEDLDFFKRMMALGRKFVWCNEAIVSEVIPPTRWTRQYLVRRALLRGRNGRALADRRAIAKALIAIPLYSAMLPGLALAGRHHLIAYLMKLGDHAGLLAGVLRLRVLGDKYLVG
jgi:succinoglycan biosynthesis protein ExoM